MPSRNKVICHGKINTFASSSAEQNPRFSACLSNSITRSAIVLESCSNPQKTRQVFESALIKVFGLGF